MPPRFNPAAALHVAAPVLAALLVNAVIYAKGWASYQHGTRDDKRSVGILPPGIVIAVIWTVLLGLMGYAHYRLRRASCAPAAWSVVALALFCIAYPFYTRLLYKSRLSLIANTATLILVSIVIMVTLLCPPAPRSIAAYCLGPTFVWASYVNLSDALVCGRSY